MENKKKRIGSNILIILLVLIILVSSAIGIWAWARYQSSIQGQAVAQVARWNFNLIDTDPQTTEEIELAITRTDNNQTVMQGKVAPGTYGEFEIGIDARGTETILNYIIEVEFINKPTNMKFYLDENKTEELVVTNDKLVKDGFMTLEDVKDIRIEKIYWNWPYETGETEEQILENDVKDTEDEGKQITMKITVTGIEGDPSTKVYLFGGNNDIEWEGRFNDGNNPNVGTYNITDDYMEVKTWGTWCSYGLKPIEDVDLSNYSKIVFEVEEVIGVGGDANARIFIEGVQIAECQNSMQLTKYEHDLTIVNKRIARNYCM